MRLKIMWGVGGFLVMLAAYAMPLMQPLMDFVDWLMK